jgi:rubrerythrin
MSRLELLPRTAWQISRRSFLERSGAVLSTSAIALLAGCTGAKAARKDDTPGSDVEILNGALAAEHQGVAAYQVGAESGLLQKPVLDLAVQFQGHHKAHADLLAATVRKLGGRPAEPKSHYVFPVETLKTQADVLRFAEQLEAGAVSAYLGAVPVLDDRELARAAASILGDEAMHVAVLRYALGENPVPSAFVG